MISAFTENTKETTGGNATHLFNHLNPRPSEKKNYAKKGLMSLQQPNRLRQMAGPLIFQLAQKKTTKKQSQGY